jgi:hypothetical protein
VDGHCGIMRYVRFYGVVEHIDNNPDLMGLIGMIAG